MEQDKQSIEVVEEMLKAAEYVPVGSCGCGCHMSTWSHPGVIHLVVNWSNGFHFHFPLDVDLSALLHFKENAEAVGRLTKEVERLRGYLERIKTSPDGSAPSPYFSHTYDDCNECAAKNKLAEEALGGAKGE